MNKNINNILTGVYENNLLNDIYFSNININYLEVKLIEIFKKKYNYLISKQSKNDLIIIMRNIYLSLAKNNYKTKIELKLELNSLNKATLKYCSNIIKRNIENKIFYLNDINNSFNTTSIKTISNPVDTRIYKDNEFNVPF